MSSLSFEIDHNNPSEAIVKMCQIENENKEIIRDFKVFKNGILVLYDGDKQTCIDLINKHFEIKLIK